MFIMAIYIWLHSMPVWVIGVLEITDATWPCILGPLIILFTLSSVIPWCPLWKWNRELSIAENKVAQILWGREKKDKKPGKALKKIGYFILFYHFFFSSSICLHALALISQLVGSQEAPLSPVLLRELQLYKMGGKCSLYELFFTLVWVQNGSCTPTLCVTAQRPAKLKSKSASRETKATIS